MEPQEPQTITSPTLSPTAENGGGDDFGRGEKESESSADSANLHQENDPSELENDSPIAEVATTATRRPSAFAKVEKSLASLGFFTPSSRRIKNQKVKRVSFTREIEGKRVEVGAEIHPSGMFGLPVTADQDKYLALQQIITDKLQSEGKVTNPIRFKSAELLRLLNNSTKTGKNYKAISEWLDVMSATTIISDGAVYVAGQKRFARDRFRVFDRALSFGKELDDGTVADANYIWLSAWQLENINSKFLVPIDLETYRELKNHIAKALVPLLQIWLFASHKAESFEKRYSDLCEILTLQTYRSPSQILRQFKPSLDELTHHGYIEKWRIEKMSDRKSYKMIFFHGPKFHRDRRKRLEQKSHAEPLLVVGEFEGAEPSLPEPGTASVAAAKVSPTQDQPKREQAELTDVQGRLVDDLSARGLMPSAVLKLIRSLPAERLETIPDYIEYWDRARKGGDVGPGFLYDLIKTSDPLPAGFETKRQQADRLAAENRSKNQGRLQEALKAEYEEHGRQAIDQFITEELPPGEFDRRVAAYMADPSNQSDFWKEKPEMAEQFARHAVRAEISKRVSLPAYEDFYRRELPRLAAKLQLDPTELGLEAREESLVSEGAKNAGAVPTGEVPLQPIISTMPNPNPPQLPLSGL
jgi:hypothetical protein